MAHNIVTPIGVAVFPHLIVPNYKFDKDGTYSVNLQLDDAVHLALSKEIEAAIAEDVTALASKHRFDPRTVKRADVPWGRSRDNRSWEYKIKNNRMCGSADRRFEFTPKLFGADSQPLPKDVKIGMGSKVRVSFSPFCWYVKGELGYSLRLKAVQVIEAKDGHSAESYGFGVVAKRLTDAEFASGTSPSDQDRQMSEEEFMAEFRKV